MQGLHVEYILISKYVKPYSNHHKKTWAARLLPLVIMVAILLAGPHPGVAMSFPQKDITFIVPVSPGGGFDTVARLLCPYISKYLPRRVNVIVKNVPGGEWVIGVTTLYRSKPDGHTIGIFNIPGNAIPMVMGRAKYDLNKITWIGTPAEITYVAALSSKSKVKTLDEARKAHEVVVATVGIGSTSHVGAIVAGEAFGIKMKAVPHQGSAEAILAGVRGDADWVQYPIGSLRKFIQSGELKPIIVFSDKRIPQLPDVPTVAELGHPELLRVVRMYRPIGAPPGLPEELTGIWRSVFAKAAQDPEFVSKMEQADLEPKFYDGEQTARLVSDSIKAVAAYKHLYK